MLSQIADISESKDNGGDWMDDTSNNNDMEMLYTMASRSRSHIRDLENALIRIRQKTYGICVITGELIDKRRLMAVPTTTKSLAAKNAIGSPVEKKERIPVLMNNSGKPKIVSKIIKKSNLQSKPIHDEEEENFSYTDFMDEDFFDDIVINDTMEGDSDE